MKIAVGVVFAALSLSCGAMAEQRIGPFLTGMAGVGDNSGSAFGAGAKYEWLFSDTLGLDLHAGYLHDSDADMGIFPLEFGPVFVIPLNSLAITLGAGGCYAIPTESEIDPALGFYAAAGIRGPISDGMEWFAEAQYVKVEGDSDTRGDYWLNNYTYVYQESGMSLDINAIGISAGILWKF